MDANEWSETYQAVLVNFTSGDTDETEFRSRLARLGFNASEVAREVELHSETRRRLMVAKGLAGDLS